MSVKIQAATTVSDPVGATVAEAIAEGGLQRPTSARCGMLYLLDGRAVKAQVEKAVAKSLANPLIHRVVVTEAHP
ncbi:MAG: phosphoribosylformylglycinamidine synthase subunit PurS [Elusimicrobia bacterium]|nr:phosphoribosylformylglycinamidine synthase subunit PurS [Elusimicrobiota bacterium]